MTVADVLLYCEFDFIRSIAGDSGYAELTNKFTVLTALRDRMAENDSIRKWTQDRPVTGM